MRLFWVREGRRVVMVEARLVKSLEGVSLKTRVAEVREGDRSSIRWRRRTLCFVSGGHDGIA
jgi:hypothetical protein